MERILKADVLPYWRDRDARTITPREVIERLDEIVLRGSPVQANRSAAILSQMFRFGVHRALLDASPVQLLYRPGGVERPRSRALSEEELRRFLRHREDACRSTRMSHVLMLLLLTLQRRGEIALARWDDFDFDRKQWAIADEHAKTGRGHVVPLTDWVLAELHALKRLHTGSAYVFPTDDGRSIADPKLITRSVARCQSRFAAYGIRAFTTHDLRRTGRTHLARLGVDQLIAERVLNHAISGMQRVYDVHHYFEEKHAALLKWECYLRRISGDE